MHFSVYLFILQFFNVHSTCFERSSRSSSGVYHSVLYYTALYSRANVSSWIHSHYCTELCSRVHYDKLLMMDDSIIRNMQSGH